MTARRVATLIASASLLLAMIPLPAQAATAFSPVSSPSTKSAPSVDAAPCTITGTARDDTLVGTAGNDVICGLGGNDIIRGGNGNDTIRGGDGNDNISGGNGNDSVTGDAGNDTVDAGPGNDSLSGGTGNDSLAGGTGNDAVLGGDGSSDNRVPEIRNVRLPWTVAPGDKFTVDIGIISDGATDVGAWFLRSPPENSRGQVFIFGIGKARLVKAYGTKAIFRQAMSVADWAPPGTYSLLVGIQDPVGYRVVVTTEFTITVTEKRRAEFPFL